MGVYLTFFSGSRLPDKYDHVERYIYLGTNAKLAFYAERRLPHIEKINFSRRLVEIQYRYREGYIDFIDRNEKESLISPWWQTRLSGKNPWISKFYLRYSQLVVLREILNEQKEALQQNPLLIITDDLAIYDCVKEIVDELGINLLKEYNARRNRIKLYSKLILRGLTRRTLILPKYFLEKLRARFWFGKKVEVAKSQVIGATFTDERSYRNQVYEDPFLGTAIENIRKDVSGITVFPIIFSFGLNRKKLLNEWCKKKGVRIGLPIQYVPFSKIFSLFLKSAVKSVVKAKAVKFNDIEVSHLINLERMEEWSDFNLQLPILSYSFSQIAISLNPSVLILPFENQIWERTVINSVKRELPDLTVIGFQNAPAPLLSLRYYNSKRFVEEVPLPDVVVANGKISFDNFRNNFSSKTRLIKSGSLRSVSVNSDYQRKSNPTSKKKIMVVCSIGNNESIELASFVYSAIKDHLDYDVVIVPHPLSTFDFDNYFRKLPSENIQVTKNGFAKEFEAADVVVYDSSTVGLQAIFHGKMAINICHSYNVHVNPNEYDREVTKYVYEASELIDILSNLDPVDMNKNRQVADDYFGFDLINKTKDIIMAVLS